MEDTVLVGCEIICIGEQKTDLIACPLSKDEQANCGERRQYLAGIKEVMEWIKAHNDFTRLNICCERHGVLLTETEWQAKRKEWGV